MLTVTIIKGEPRTVIELPDGSRERCRSGIYSAARKMLARGYDPETAIAAVWRDGTPSWNATRLGDLAEWSLSETDRGGLRRIKYQPMPAEAMGGAADG